MADAAAAGTQFVVTRRNWRRDRNGDFRRYPGEARVASFPTAGEAEAYRREHEARARAAVNPFAGDPAAPAGQATMPEPVLCDWLRDHGVDPPGPGPTGRRDWPGWWRVSARRWAPAQVAAVWDGLDRVRFYTVAERPAGPVVYAVVAVDWGYNDEWYYPGEEGGRTLAVYRSREAAEDECRRRTPDARWLAFGRPAPGGIYLEGRLLPGEDPFAGPADDHPGREVAPADAPFFEVVELDWEGEG